MRRVHVAIVHGVATHARPFLLALFQLLEYPVAMRTFFAARKIPIRYDHLASPGFHFVLQLASEFKKAHIGDGTRQATFPRSSIPRTFKSSITTVE